MYRKFGWDWGITEHAAKTQGMDFDQGPFLMRTFGMTQNDA